MAWKNLDPTLKKRLAILVRCVVGIVVVYMLFTIALALLTEPDFFDGWFTLLVFGIVGLVLTPPLIAVANLIRWRLVAKHGGIIPDERLDQGLSWVAFVSGILSVGLFLLETLLDVDFKYPWDQLDVYAQIRGIAFTALMVCVFSLALNLVAQLILKRLQSRRGDDKDGRRGRYTRIIAIGLMVLSLLGNLLIPHTNGCYNDSGGRGTGSEYHEAVLYDVVEWNRTHTFGGDRLPDEEQRTRIYFFPFNCYKYEAQWDMKH